MLTQRWGGRQINNLAAGSNQVEGAVSIQLSTLFASNMHTHTYLPDICMHVLHIAKYKLHLKLRIAVV